MTGPRHPAPAHRDAGRARARPRLVTMADDEEYEALSERRQRRIKITAWVVIVALILTAGGATVFALLFG